MLMNTSTIDGMQVTRSFNIKDKSGAILVALGDSGLFSVSFRGMSNDALMVTKRFNWKAVQAQPNLNKIGSSNQAWAHSS
jgi:hypothetical protein